jgi:hypothetical protein
LHGIWGSGPNDIYVAPYINAILHSTGDGTWQHQPFSSGYTFDGVWGSGRNDVYAYGPGAFHSTGGGLWTIPGQDITTLGCHGEPILSMWGSSATDVYAAGGVQDVYHSRGDGTWGVTLDASPNPMSVSGSSATDVYAINGSKLFHSTGNGTWRVQSVPLGDRDYMLSVWALRKDAVYITTGNAVLRSGGDGNWVEQVITPNNPTLNINGIWGTSPTNLYLATYAGVLHGTFP